MYLLYNPTHKLEFRDHRPKTTNQMQKEVSYITSFTVSSCQVSATPQKNQGISQRPIHKELPYRQLFLVPVQCIFISREQP